MSYGAPPPPAPALFIPHGASVGMAVKEAIALTVEYTNADDVGGSEFWKTVYKHSSDILRLMHTLESGRLAPKTGAAPAAETPPPPPAVSRPQPGPGGSVAPNNLDKDVPF